MDKDLFESLLYEEESATLDFKKEQYRFSKATDDEKSELLKDILGFANAWRRSKAYILIGVEEVRGGRSQVLGIASADQLDDHSLQQFINNQTNTPLRFHYRAFAFEGKQVGIISIDEVQARPVYLKKPYGKLDKDKVYVRRGSSTDPTKPASPEEIAQMGAGGKRHSAELVVEFSEVETDALIGNILTLSCEFCEVPERKRIPKLKSDRHAYLIPDRYPNEDYYRDVAEYEFMTSLHRPTRVTVRNVGEVAATNVRIEVTASRRDPVSAILDVPQKPEQFGWKMPSIRPINRREPGAVDIDQNSERTRIEIECGDLQPGRQVWSNRFFVGAAVSGDHLLEGRIFADNLPTPQSFSLTVSAAVTRSSLTVEDICKQ